MMNQHDPALETDVVRVAGMRDQHEPFLLLDVREPDEYATARIEGSELIPMSQLGERLTELEPHRSAHIIVHCHHGIRSLQVAQALRSRGFAKVQSMAGGIDQWSLQVDPGIPRY